MCRNAHFDEPSAKIRRYTVRKLPISAADTVLGTLPASPARTALCRGSNYPPIRNGSKMPRFARSTATISTLGILIFAAPAAAHVKWFSNYDWSTPPTSIPEILTPTFWAMFVLSLVCLAGAVWLDKVTNSLALQKISDWFEQYSDSSLLVMRIAAFATLLVAWQQGTLLTPETVITNLWIERLQFTVILLLLFPQTTTLAGLGFLALWLYGLAEFGIFHMLDYVNALGFAYFLIVRPLKNPWLRDTAIPMLYSTVGITLMWLGCEKLVFPQWALYILDQNPILTLGLPSEFFLTAAAFVELGLGFMLLICLFSRSLSVTITLVFFLTTMVFGKVEIIGHTLVHASLIVFLLEGPGHRFTPPSLFHNKLPWRTAFTTVNFAIVIFLMLFAYTFAAKRISQPQTAHVHPKYEVTDPPNAPTVRLEATPDSKSGWNIRLITNRFRFRPDAVGSTTIEGEGHAHMYLDGQKIARVYGEWYHLPNIEGEHEVRVTLNTNDHQDYAVDGVIVGDSIQIGDASTDNQPVKALAFRQGSEVCIGPGAKRRNQ